MELGTAEIRMVRVVQKCILKFGIGRLRNLQHGEALVFKCRAWAVLRVVLLQSIYRID